MFALIASISTNARKHSPSTGKTVQNRPIFASRANFFAVPQNPGTLGEFFRADGSHSHLKTPADHLS